MCSLLLLSVASGMLLALYYRVSCPHASLIFIVESVSYGPLVRGVHHWSAQALIALTILHALRGILQGRYKVSARAWVAGALMGFGLLGCGFSGRLLAWGQEGYWGTVIGLKALEALPLAGEALGRFFAGSDAIALPGVGRLHALHTLLLPAALCVLMLFHLQGPHQLWEHLFGFMGRAGLVGRPQEPRRPGTDRVSLAGVLKESMEILSILGLVLAAAFLFPPGVGEEANPFVTPPHIKPAWYFLFVYQGLKYFPKETGVLLFLVLVPAAFTLLPLLDRTPPQALHPLRRPLATALFLLGLGAWAALTVLGWVA
jgi:quinol-cytochrome oxidoreductase complex cytochrome b subunit